MVAPVAEKLMTAEQFFRLPDPEEGGKMELIAGRVVVHMPVSHGHGKRASRIVRKLGAFADDHDLGETSVEVGFRLFRNPDTVRAPDVAFVSKAMLPEGGIPDEGFAPCVPTLAVEVISPDETDTDVTTKVDQYLRSGVQRVWLVRKRQQSVTVLRPDGTVRTLGLADTLSSDDAAFDVEGFHLPLADLFA